MATEADDNLTAVPTANRELISAAIEAVKSQGQDINPYSVAQEAKIPPEILFINREFMSMVIEARGDKATFSIDSQLAERCQELEAERDKLLQVNNEIYDRALEMEERVIQLETRISDMEEEAEHLTMQLQNSWALGYKKGQSDAQAQPQTPEQAPVKTEEPVAIRAEVQAEAPSSKKSIIDIELSAEEKEAIQKEALEKVHAEKQPSAKQSIMSMIDIELPEAEAAATPISQTDFSAAESKGGQVDTSDNPTTGDHEPVTEVAPPAAVPAADANPTYNDRVFNAVADSYTPSNMVESYGGMSWREVETIYQYSSAGGASGPNLVYEPMTQPTSNADSPSPSAAAPAPAQTAAASSRTDTQPIGSRSDTQPIYMPKDEAAAPPILKADAPTPKAPDHKPSPNSTFTRLTAKKLEIEPDPPMERTMSQFLGDTQSYINLDRVTLEPEEGQLKPASASPAPAAQVSPPPATVEETRPTAAQSQLETQTLQGAAQAMAAAAEARASGAIPPGDSASFMAAASAAAAQQAQQAQQAEQASLAEQIKREQAAPAAGPGPGPSDARWGRRDAGATYDGLTALDSDSTNDILDLEKLDIFEGLEDIDDLSQIEVIEDVIIPEPPPAEGAPKKGRFKSSEHVPVVSSDDLHDLIKSRIKKAEEPHEPPRVDAFISTGDKDKGAAASNTTGTMGTSSTASSANTTSTTGNASASADTASTTGADSAAPPPVPTAKELEALRQGARNKFVGGKAAAGAPSGNPNSTSSDNIGAPTSPGPGAGISARAVPPEIRKACMILGVRPEDLTLKEVHEKWKAQIAAPGAHPDQGGDTESAIYLNTAKDTLVKWINDQSPKLGKKFGKGEK